MGKIILVTGGIRSGKSEFAEQMALQLSPNPVYLATAQIFDEEFQERVIKHQQRRGSQWGECIEEPRRLSEHDLTGKVVVIDCLTFWATTGFSDYGEIVDLALPKLVEDLDNFTSKDGTFIFVTNEVGFGGTTENDSQRRFIDLQGYINRHVAAKADEVYLIVSGIPTKIK